MKRALLIGLPLLLLGLAFWWWMERPDLPTHPRDPIAQGPRPALDGAGFDVSGPGAPAASRVVQTIAPSGVRLRIEKRPRLDLPSPPYAARMAELQAASDRGDPVARYQLGTMFYQCRDVPVDEAGLAKGVEEIHQTRTRGGWDVSDPAQEEQALRTSYSNCVGVPPEARSRFRELLRSAADLGLIEAQLNLMFYLPQAEYCQFIEDCTPEQAQFMAGLRDEARVNVSKALEGGSVEALRTVGGWALNEEMGTPDDVEAYAHFSAYDQVQQATGRERELRTMLAGLRKRLRPVDLAQAEQRAKELLSNPNCCILTR